MSYQVLARKWRPKTFREMAGQAHVLKALINALDHDRLHHAYLFTGTRGVGKTTIARILAKCLNCDAGVSSEPCGQCQSCVAITEGRFVDLIEVDAASRTKVEDTRELLDNVQYAPSQGRYKVYLIDEVHMLSSSSFNALLKTLEEPPPHVKFLLATTDPQKIPATILSRCLQFSLKNLSAERIVEYLKTVLDKEMVAYEEAALWLLGRAADGSMRDALSLTDQAIAFGSGKLGEADVGQMLGTIDHGAVYRLVEALAARDGAGLLSIVAELGELGADFSAVATELLHVLHRLALAQTVPEGLDNSLGDREKILNLAATLSGEQVQFYYQMTLTGRRDLGLAPDLRSGLEMMLLRILAFCPEGVISPPAQELSAAQGAAAPQVKKPLEGGSALPRNDSAPEPARAAPSVESSVAASSDTVSSAAEPGAGNAQQAARQAMQAALSGESSVESRRESADVASSPAGEQLKRVVESPVVDVAEDAAPAEAPEQRAPSPAKLPYAELTPATWREYFDHFMLPGMLGSVAGHCQIAECAGERLAFVIDQRNATLLNERHIEKLQTLLSEYFAMPLQVSVSLGETHEETPAAYRERQLKERIASVKATMEGDPLVQKLLVEFDAEIEEGSVRPSEC